VNVLAGTAGGAKGGQHHSTGNVLPLVAAPWGFNHWAPQTVNDQTAWWFDSAADTFRGIRCTHQPSPWIGDYGWFVLRPYLGYDKDEWLGFTSYHAASAIKPWMMDLSVGPDGVRMELTPTSHGAILRVVFPSVVQPGRRKICAWVPDGTKKDADEKRAVKTGRPTGSCQVSAGGINVESRRFAGGVPEEGDYTFHARLEADGHLRAEKDGSVGSTFCFEMNMQYVPLNMPGTDRTTEENANACQRRCQKNPSCKHFTFWPDGGCHIQDGSAKAEKGQDITAGPPNCPVIKTPRQCCFYLGDNTEAVVRIGTSFISSAQAMQALDQEVGTQSYEDARDEMQMTWRAELSAIRVEEAGDASADVLRKLEIFYTCLYRVLLFPRRLDELTPKGVQHWSPYSGKVMDGVGVTDNGFWDTFRTVYPLLALAYPRQLGEIIQGWLNAYLAGGWLPKWASPGYRDSMVGTFADVVIADAIIKNISGFDHQVAWEALKKDAYGINPAPKDTSRGKFGLQHYQDKGYIPVDIKIGEACSRTLDFAFADAAVSVAAQILGQPEEAKKLHARAVQGLRQTYDPYTGLMGHKKADGTFKDVSPETWGDCYTEGSAWHHSFPPFDLDVLEELHDGRDALLQKLQELFTLPSSFKVGTYKVEIHEMREMRMLGLGQYAHNNQPVHHLPVLFAMLGDRNTTYRLVRRILSAAYSPEGFAGDEDNGEMGAWYVLNAMGLYSAAPGVSEDYVLSALPLFDSIHLRDLDIIIEAPDASHSVSPIVAKVLWQAEEVKHHSIPYSALRAGGTLTFEVGSDEKHGAVIKAPRSYSSHSFGDKFVERTKQVVNRMRGAMSTSRRHQDTSSESEDEGLSGVACLGIIAVTIGAVGLLLRTTCRRAIGNEVKPD